MGNLSFLVPTKNLEDFNRENIAKMIKTQFPKFSVEESTEWNQIEVRNKKGTLITQIYCNQECYLLDYDKDMEELRNPENRIYNCNEMIFKLQILRSYDPDLNNCISLTYGTGMYVDEKFEIERFLMLHFNGYLFDEGIHPEFQTFEEI